MPNENVQLHNTTGALGNSIRAHLAKETLAIADKYVRFLPLGDKLDLGGGNGKTWTATRYKRIALPKVALSEGVTPDGSNLATEQVSGTAEQWGGYVTLSDVSQLTLYHPALVKANELLGKNAAETVDREIQVALEGVTNINYAGDRTVRSDLTGGNVLASKTILKAVSQLRDYGAPEFDGQNFVGVVDPLVEADMVVDSTFIDVGKYQKATPLMRGEFGQWMGVRFIRSNFVRKYYGAGALTAVSGVGGTFTTGSYPVTCVGYDSSNKLNLAITSTTEVAVAIATGSLAVTVPSSPAGYVWDVYSVAGTGGTPLKSSASHLIGVKGGSSVVITGTGSLGDGDAAPTAPVTGITVHNVWIFGKGAFGVIDLTGIERTLTKNEASDSDPLAQRRKTGWKAFFKAVPLNDNFMKKIEVASAFD